MKSFNINGIKVSFVWIPPGSFWMGSGDDDEEAFDDEKPRHLVTLTRGFWLAETPCTQAVWKAAMKDEPSEFLGAKRPVERVSWGQVQEFIAQLSNKGFGRFRLPTEAEWEYACHAGSEGPRYGELDQVAWHFGNSGGETKPVRQKAPNPWGLYDMLGNVWEWCADGQRDYTQEPVTDPRGPYAETRRVIRGGSWYDRARGVRAAVRFAFDPSYANSFLGFRLAFNEKWTSDFIT